MSIEILKPGALSTFQDLGRKGSQHIGAPVCGAMDEISHRIANAAVGNPSTTATLEITLIGPTLRFDSRAVIAWYGADLTPTVDGTTVPPNCPVLIHPGQTLQFGKRQSGFRTYLAVQGGFELDGVLGSTSTYLRGGFGGFKGRALKKNDRINLLPGIEPNTRAAAKHSASIRALIRDYDPMQSGAPIRVVWGREMDHFTPTARSTFASNTWTLSPQSDRMGIRLSGEPVERLVTTEILSVPIAMGTIQIPPDGLPIILMADRQTVGGYPKIAHVITVDLPRLAQYGPGSKVEFEAVTHEVAQTLIKHRAKLLVACEMIKHETIQ